MMSTCESLTNSIIFLNLNTVFILYIIEIVIGFVGKNSVHVISSDAIVLQAYIIEYCKVAIWRIKCKNK